MSEKAKGWPMLAVWVGLFVPGIAIIVGGLFLFGLVRIAGMGD